MSHFLVRGQLLLPIEKLEHEGSSLDRPRTSDAGAALGLSAPACRFQV